MKTLIIALVALTFTTSAWSANLHQSALNTLLTTSGLVVAGDVHPNETAQSIYADAKRSGASIVNRCKVIEGQNIASCVLWLTYSPIGETAIEYSVVLPGEAMADRMINVSRGD